MAKKIKTHTTKEDNKILAVLGYPIGIIALIAVIIEKKDKFVKFHAIQALFYWIAVLVVVICLSIVATIFSVIPVFGWAIATLIWVVESLICLGAFILGIVYALKVNENETFELPYIGKMAKSYVK